MSRATVFLTVLPASIIALALLAIVVLVTQAAEASTTAVVSGGATAFLAVWGAMSLSESIGRTRPRHKF